MVTYNIYLTIIKINGIATFLKAAPRFELGIEDLQSTALPLGHIALKETIIYNISYILIKVKEIKQLILG